MNKVNKNYYIHTFSTLISVKLSYFLRLLHYENNNPDDRQFFITKKQTKNVQFLSAHLTAWYLGGTYINRNIKAPFWQMITVLLYFESATWKSKDLNHGILLKILSIAEEKSLREKKFSCNSIWSSILTRCNWIVIRLPYPSVLSSEIYQILYILSDSFSRWYSHCNNTVRLIIYFFCRGPSINFYVVSVGGPYLLKRWQGGRWVKNCRFWDDLVYGRPLITLFQLTN